MKDTIIIKYEASSTKEITERQISNISARVSNGKFFIAAYCHLKDGVKSFTVTNILEIRVNGVIVDRDLFYYNNIRDKKKFMADLEKSYIQIQNEYNKFLGFYNHIKSGFTQKAVEGLVKEALQA